MQHAHQAGLVHRDIKPANLLLSRTGVVKVLDLGLARFFHEDAAAGDGHSDQASWARPTTWRRSRPATAGDVDIRADIYSLGATFYFLLAGRAPFADGTLNQKLLWHQMKAPPPVRRLRPEVPEAMAAVAARMMAKAPADRYQTPAEVAAALAPWTPAAAAAGVVGLPAAAAHRPGRASVADGLPFGRVHDCRAAEPRRDGDGGAYGPRRAARPLMRSRLAAPLSPATLPQLPGRRRLVPPLRRLLHPQRPARRRRRKRAAPRRTPSPP